MDKETSAFGVYVAGAASPESSARVSAAIAALRAHGFAITCTWPDVVAKVGNANPRGASQVDRRGWAITDLAEIDAADALLFLVPTPPETTRGGWWEASHAHDTNKHLIIAGDTKQSVFCALGVEFETDAAAIAYLRVLRDRARIERGLNELCRQSQWPEDHDLGGEGG